MNLTRRSITLASVALAGAVGPLGITLAHADDRDRLVADGLDTLHKLEDVEPKSRLFNRHAVGVLVFPSVVKAGFIFGGEGGNGVLFEHGRPAGFYNLTGGSWGLQIGGQDFSYVLFFMTGEALDALNTAAGLAAGTGPSIVVVNQGAAAEADTTTLGHDIYAFPFNGKGLMADLTLQGTRISRIHPS